MPDHTGDTGNDGGHEIYEWMYPELFRFVDLGERPDRGELDPTWQTEPTGSTPMTLISVFFSFKNFATPHIVPPVPIPQINVVILPVVNGVVVIAI